MRVPEIRAVPVPVPVPDECERIVFHARPGVLHGASTMVRLQLDERQWRQVEVALAAEKRRGRRGRDDRNFVEAVLW